jgi:HSP20 family molecular chaperone IbpA
VNLLVGGGRVVVLAPVPGMRPEQIRVVLHGTQLTLRSVDQPDDALEYLLHEWDPAGLDRTLELPIDVGWPLTASVVNGVLTVSLGLTADAPDEPVEITPSSDRPVEVHLEIDLDGPAVELTET